MPARGLSKGQCTPSVYSDCASNLSERLSAVDLTNEIFLRDFHSSVFLFLISPFNILKVKHHTVSSNFHA